MCASEVTPKNPGLSAHEERLLAKAHQVLSRHEAPPSPCVSVCVMSDQTQLCAGCWRSLDEIAGWGARNDADKRQVWSNIQARLQVARDGVSLSSSEPPFSV